MSKGAMTLAEGSQHKDYKTDATLILNGVDARGYILRTAYDPLSVWKSKYSKGTSPFYPRLKTSVREAALIDNEIWVFGIDATRSKDIIDAVTIATIFYKVPANYFLGNIYIKNLNAEGERGMDLKLLVDINRKLYEQTVVAIREACVHFGMRESVNVHVYSSNINHKIPKDVLHGALKSGGANNVQTDDRELNYKSGGNDHVLRARVDTNMHVARLDF